MLRSTCPVVSVQKSTGGSPKRVGQILVHLTIRSFVRRSCDTTPYCACTVWCGAAIALAVTPTWVVHDHANLVLTVAVMTAPSLACALALTSTVKVCDCCAVNAALSGLSVSLVTERSSLTSNVSPDQTYANSKYSRVSISGPPGNPAPVKVKLSYGSRRMAS